MSRSVERALSILNLFDCQKAEWGITEISRELDLSKSTVHGLVKSMEKHDFLQMADNGKYGLGIKVYELGRTYSGNIRLNSAAEPMIKWLSKKYKESVHLAIYAGNKAVFIINNHAGSEGSAFPKAGAEVFAYCTAVGKVLLAFQPEEDIDKYLINESLIPLTPNTIIDPELLRSELKIVKQQRFAIDREEALPGIACVAAPIFSVSRQIIAAISVSGNSAKMLDDQVLSWCCRDVVQAAQTISELMGYMG